jgi:hypothetical protein
VVQLWVVYALFTAVAQKDESAGLAVLAKADPLVRWRARARLRRVMREVPLLTNVADEAHYLRLAYLKCAAGRLEADADDVQAIESAIASLPVPKTPRRGPWLVGAFGLLILLIVAGSAVLWRVSRPFDPREVSAGPLLATALPEWVAAVFNGKGEDADLAPLRERIHEETQRAALAAPLQAELDQLLRVTEALPKAPPAELTGAGQRFVSASVAVNRELAGAGLPYFIDADSLVENDVARPLLMSFYVQRERFLAVGGREERAVHLWRLDSLNVNPSLLGFTRPYSPVAIVLLDAIEEDLILYFLPGLAPNEPVILVDEATESRNEAWAMRLGARAGELVRKYRKAAMGERYPELERIGTLLARRRELVRKWQANLRGLGFEMRIPLRLRPERDYAEQLETRITRASFASGTNSTASCFSPKMCAPSRRCGTTTPPT